jgi:ATP/maltotriose-dependent transcriptional regulator MalT
MAPVAARVSSPRFVGRGAQLARLRAAYDAAANDEHAATVLVAGEAGVGKTRLVREFAREVEDRGGLALIGGCLEFVDRAMPFGPIVEALRQLHRRVDAPALDDALGSTRSELARLLPELGVVTRTPIDEEAPTARLFEHLLSAFERIGDLVPTVLVIEDLHWADRSTRDLLVFLARNLRDGRVLVVGTYRTDDLHRRHPLRPVLAELERSGVERLDVERFTRAEVHELLAGILDHEPGADLVGRIHDRSDGNAFFAEELLAASDDCQVEVSPSLRDVVLARLDALPPAVQPVLRVAAVIGRRAEHRLLVALADRPEAELHEGLREAVANQVLLTDPNGDTYEFRHALAQEVVYDDLLPGERVRMHARLAQLLSDDPSLFNGSPEALANELACHWNAARDQRRALEASYRAARVAEEMYAYPEALAHAERTLELWPLVPDAADLVGLDEVGLLRFAALQADLGGEIDRAAALFREASARVDPETDPVTAGVLLERQARVAWQRGKPASELLALNHRAVDLVPADPPSTERAQVLAALGQQLMLAGHNAEAIEWCEQAITVAQVADAPAIEGHARNTLGTVLAHLGDVEDGLVQLHAARDLARELRAWGDLARAAINESGVLQADGQHDAAIDIAIPGADEARRHGLDRSYGAFLRLNGVGSLFALGRWPEAEEQLREIDAVDPVGVDAKRVCEEWAALHIARGEFDLADAAIAHDRSLATERPWPEVDLARRANEVRLLRWRAEPERAYDVVMTSWLFEDGSALGRFECPDWSDELLVEGIGAAADAAERARARRDADAEATAIARAQALREQLRLAHERFTKHARAPFDVPIRAAFTDAEVQRALGRSDPQQWYALAETWATASRPPLVAYARWREAAARLQRGDGASFAAEALREAHTVARRLGYVPLLAAVDDLARRARIDVGDGAEAETPRSPLEQAGLTAREQEVLDLLSAGRTNRQIADELFISAKTASVHVSNILAKLNVANRGEAAARARELGLEQAAAR